MIEQNVRFSETDPLLKDKEIEDEIHNSDKNDESLAVGRQGLRRNRSLIKTCCSHKTTSNKELENQQQFFLPSPP